MLVKLLGGATILFNCIKFEPICKDIAVTLCICLIQLVRQSYKKQNERNVQIRAGRYGPKNYHDNYFHIS